MACRIASAGGSLFQRNMGSEHLHVTFFSQLMWQCERKGKGTRLARPECAQMSEKSTPRRSSEAKAVISALQQDLLQSQMCTPPLHRSQKEIMQFFGFPGDEFSLCLS